jgi:hypothetical protein
MPRRERYPVPDKDQLPHRQIIVEVSAPPEPSPSAERMRYAADIAAALNRFGIAAVVVEGDVEEPPDDGKPH